MSHTTDLGKDRIPILVLKLAIPSMIAQFVTVLYSIIDRMFIGNIPKIGDAALAGVGVCGPIVTLLTSFWHAHWPGRFYPHGHAHGCRKEKTGGVHTGSQLLSDNRSPAA